MTAFTHIELALARASRPRPEARLPLLDRPQLEALLDAFPPRCMRLGETEGEHLRYAGRRELIEELLGAFIEAHTNGDDGDIELEDPLVAGEKAT